MQTDTTVLTEQQLRHFDEEGFVVVPGVLSPEHVAELRASCEKLFSSKPIHDGDIQLKNDTTGRAGGVRMDIVARYPEFRFIIEEPRITGALRSLLGDDFLLIPESAAHDSRYGHWHKDTTPMERAGLSYQYEPDFRLVQCAIYLQDNDEHGGGLDIVPGSQRERDHTPPTPKVSLVERIANKLNIRLNRSAAKPAEEPGAYSIPSKAGDLVMFNFLANHQATQPADGNVAAIPAEKRKFAIFFGAGANNRHTLAYREYIAPIYPHLREHSYPEEVQAVAEANGVRLI